MTVSSAATESLSVTTAASSSIIGRERDAELLYNSGTGSASAFIGADGSGLNFNSDAGTAATFEVLFDAGGNGLTANLTGASGVTLDLTNLTGVLSIGSISFLPVFLGDARRRMALFHREQNYDH